VLEWIKKLHSFAVTLVKNYKGRRKHQVKKCILRHVSRSFILAAAKSSAHRCYERPAPFVGASRSLVPLSP